MTCCPDSKKDSPIQNVNIWLTEGCTFRCVYCYEKPEGYKPKVLDKKLIYDIITWMLAMSGNSSKIDLSLFGGEPLLEFDLIVEFNEKRMRLTRTSNKEISMGIVTNLYLLTPEILQYLVKNNISILPSIDGCHKTMAMHRGRGSYEEKYKMGEGVIENAKQIIKYYPPDRLTARMTWTDKNLPYLLEDFKFLYNLGFRHIFHAYPDDGYRELTDEELKTYEYIILNDVKNWIKELKYIPLNQISQKMNRYFFNSPCGAGRGFCGIDTEGNVYPCHRFVFWKEWQIGNVFELKTDMDKRNLFIKYDNKKNSEKCRDCLLKGCGGQCYASSYAKYKDIYKIDESACKINSINWKLVEELRKEEMFKHYTQSPNNQQKIQQKQPVGSGFKNWTYIDGHKVILPDNMVINDNIKRNIHIVSNGCLECESTCQNCETREEKG